MQHRISTWTNYSPGNENEKASEKSNKLQMHSQQSFSIGPWRLKQHLQYEQQIQVFEKTNHTCVVVYEKYGTTGNFMNSNIWVILNPRSTCKTSSLSNVHTTDSGEPEKNIYGQ